LADIKLFQIEDGCVRELQAQSVAIERSLQNLLERNLERFLGVRLLASEYSTGKTHGGRIDTLGVDDDNCPVIIEYKRALNENVISQGLYYLDWLLGTHWRDDELDAIVADYFAMLEADLAGRQYVKSRHSQALMAQIGRTHRSVEFKLPRGLNAAPAFFAAARKPSSRVC
jgi:hypothetical protein